MSILPVNSKLVGYVSTFVTTAVKRPASEAPVPAILPVWAGEATGRIERTSSNMLTLMAAVDALGLRVDALEHQVAALLERQQMVLPPIEYGGTAPDLGAIERDDDGRP
jgi:hypothetical protein